MVLAAARRGVTRLRRAVSTVTCAFSRYLRERRLTVAVDLALLAAWAFGLLWLVELLAWPDWAYHAGLLAGVAAYSLVAGWWE